MTEPDVVWTFLRALPDRARHDLNRTDRLVIAIHRAVNDHGWTPEQLAKHCAKGITRQHQHPGSIVLHRVFRAAGQLDEEDFT